jgi:hypothetical protein
MSTRLNILTAIQTKLETLSGLGTVFYWHDLDFEYGQPAIAFRDLDEDYTVQNLAYQNELNIELRAIAFTENLLADSEALLDALIQFVRDETWNGYGQKTILVRSEKSVDTKGKKAVLVSLFFRVLYRS